MALPPIPTNIEIPLTFKQELLSINKFISYIPEYPILINTPRNKLIGCLLYIWALLFFTTIFSTGIIWIVTIEVFLFVGYLIYSFSKVWKAYGYSKTLYWIMTFSVLILSFAYAAQAREFLYIVFDLFNKFIDIIISTIARYFNGKSV